MLYIYIYTTPVKDMVLEFLKSFLLWILIPKKD